MVILLKYTQTDPSNQPPPPHYSGADKVRESLGAFFGRRLLIRSGEVTNAENIKADSPKILTPTHFSCIKNIKAEKLVVGVVP